MHKFLKLAVLGLQLTTIWLSVNLPFSFLIHWLIIQWGEIAKNAHHKACFFLLFSVLKPKDIKITIASAMEKQQILTIERLELENWEIFGTFAWKYRLSI